ncbi:MAG: error-prone DNA polymerase, partial [Myxococcota bacterium]
YGFPESHAISFALLGYASIWLKTHYPAAYVCALLNSQPMGFYAPHTLIDDARRHGVEVRPIDVEHSHWDCTLEEGEDDWALRVGVRYVSGLGSTSNEAYEVARSSGKFKTVEAFAGRTGFDRGSLSAMAHAGAFRSLNRDERQLDNARDLCRRAAYWAVLRPRSKGERPALRLADDPAAEFFGMTEMEEVRADFATAGLTAGRHPMAFIRNDLTASGVYSVAALSQVRNGRRVQVAGLIIGRQHPGTANGFVFLSLEDETGLLNVVITPQLFEKQRTEATRYPLLLITGQVQSQNGALSLKAQLLKPLLTHEHIAEVPSRDFR